jgi:hypothetical protein
LKNAGMEEPVSRLLWASGKETILACYHVGIYSNQELIGQGKKCFSETDLLDAVYTNVPRLVF